VSTDGYVVTFWEPVAAAERSATAGQFGDLLRRLHWLEEPAELGLARLEPLGEPRDLLEAGEGLTAEDRSFLQGRAATLGKRYDDLDFVLPPGLIHGDSWVGSAPLDGQGRAVLTDLEGFAVGPREWDLALTALSFDRYGWHTQSEYDAFVHAYGFDVRNWYGFETLADLHELVMTVRLATAVASRPPPAPGSAELARRLTDLRAGADRHG
jgi:fructosamine-3-kinase